MIQDSSEHRQSASTDEETIAVLLVEDNPGDARLFKHHINTDRSPAFPTAAVTHTESLTEALTELETAAYDIVLLDLGLPQSCGVETLNEFRDATANQVGIDPPPIVVLTGLEDDRTAVEAIEQGAQDYLVKDNVNRKILNRTIRYAIERHTQEQKLRRQKEQLEEFASVVSHDLRNPLQVAIGHLDVIENEDLDPVEQNLDRMEAIIDDMLTLARTGQEVTNIKPVDLGELARQCWGHVPTAAATLNVSDDVVVEGDPGRCEQLIENIFRNSVEHAGEDVTVRVASTDGGFVIEDDGPGIPEDKREKVFESGYTTERDGTGFGLNIVQAVATAHGWSVEITDGIEGGACFEFTVE